MKVLEFKNLTREEGQIFYIRNYACDAVLELPTTSIEAKISFAIEMNPFGARTVNIAFSEPLNYPVLPVMKALKEYIIKEDLDGHLPC